jgi:Lipid A core - O-antigen ligase and related enzymes
VNKVLYDAVLQGDSAVLLSERMKVAKYPFSMTASDKYICLTDIKPSRVLSFFDLSGPSNRNRLSMWRIGWEMFKDHPFFGVGDIDLAVLFKQYNRPYEKEIKGHLHNNFIHILATLGGFGFIVIVAFFTVIIRKSCQIFRKTPEKSFERALVMGAIGGFASFIGSGLTEFNFGDHEIITMVWFSAGLVFAIDRLMLYKKEKETDGYYFRKDFESAV